MDPDTRLVLKILCGGLIFYTLLVLLVAFWLPTNDKVYVLFSGILGNFTGSLFTWLQMRKKGDDSNGNDRRQPPQ